jgi:hypothetical protein
MMIPFGFAQFAGRRRANFCSAQAFVVVAADRRKREKAGHGGVTRRDRLRRVVLLCAHFVRNLAYYRAGHDRLTKTSPPFWITVDGNFIDTAVIEWCKLFGDRKEKHFWANVVADQSGFEAEMLHHLGMTAAQFDSYIDEMRTYRDKFLAHLDDLTVMDIPFLERAKAAVEFYHSHVVKLEAAADDLRGLPNNLADYYQDCFDEARVIYARCG